MKNNIKISILIPICNVERFLPQCLDSIINQTLKCIEIICINDGSKDNSLDIIRQYAEKDRRIVVLDKPNSGYGDSMNRGLALAQGEYIGIVESDDFVEQDMFENLLSVAQEFSADIVRGNYFLYWSDKGNIKNRNTDFNCFDKCVTVASNPELLLFAPSIWTSIYKRKFLESNDIKFLPTPGASYQDTSFFLKSYILASKVFVIDKAFLHYRQDNANSSVKNCSLEKALYVNKEFSECDKFLSPALISNINLQKYYNTKKLRTYLWNISRMSVTDAVHYSDIITNEVSDILSTKNCDFAKFSTVDKQILHSISNGNKTYLKVLLGVRKIKRAHA